MLAKFKTLAATTGIALSVLAALPRNAVAATIYKTVAENGAQRGSVTNATSSLGLLLVDSTSLSFQGKVYSGNYTDRMRFASEYVKFNKESGSVVEVSAPSGAGGIGTSPFVLSTLDLSALLGDDPQLFALTGANSLSMKFTYLSGNAMRYTIGASDINPDTGGLMQLTMAGTLSMDMSARTMSNVYSAVLKETFIGADGSPNSLQIVSRGTSQVRVPEPSSVVSILMFGIVAVGFSNKLRKQRDLT